MHPVHWDKYWEEFQILPPYHKLPCLEAAVRLFSQHPLSSRPTPASAIAKTPLQKGTGTGTRRERTGQTRYFLCLAILKFVMRFHICQNWLMSELIIIKQSDKQSWINNCFNTEKIKNPAHMLYLSQGGGQQQLRVQYLVKSSFAVNGQNIITQCIGLISTLLANSADYKLYLNVPKPVKCNFWITFLH